MQRHYRLIHRYGISLQQYNDMLERQDYRCKVCGLHVDDERMSLAVDHNHQTGEIRGLLCYDCNRRFIGPRNDPVLYEKAAQYLRQGTGIFVSGKVYNMDNLDGD